MGWLRQFPPFRHFSKFSSLWIYTSAVEYHIYIWQVSLQLSCGDTCRSKVNLLGTYARSKNLFVSAGRQWFNARSMIANLFRTGFELSSKRSHGEHLCDLFDVLLTWLYWYKYRYKSWKFSFEFNQQEVPIPRPLVEGLGVMFARSQLHTVATKSHKIEIVVNNQWNENAIIITYAIGVMFGVMLYDPPSIGRNDNVVISRRRHFGVSKI